MLKKQRAKERYDTERKLRVQGCASKDLTSTTSKHKQTRILSSNKIIHDIESQFILSQHQLNQNKRALRSGSKTKYDSMHKLRKQFLKNGYTSYEYQHNQNQRKIVQKAEAEPSEDKVGIEQLHCRLVKLHQNVRKMHQQC